MEQLTTLDIKHFRSRLLALRAELQAVDEIGKEAAQIVKLDQSCVGRLSRMDALQAQAMSQETNRRRTIELQRIDIALRRIDEGTFGYCLRCDEPVSKGRLEVNPTATLCINCASNAES
ncbi:MAG: TraR/DksA family transcriptional regulator [Candidatus Polarisedimenticolaceae bacterium]|nr:TraR/DksA family transcriptional regulator [Candidatus Polarisedimenticolaceae bacterium]